MPHGALLNLCSKLSGGSSKQASRYRKYLTRYPTRLRCSVLWQRSQNVCDVAAAVADADPPGTPARQREGTLPGRSRDARKGPGNPSPDCRAKIGKNPQTLTPQVWQICRSRPPRHTDTRRAGGRGGGAPPYSILGFHQLRAEEERFWHCPHKSNK